MKQQKNVEIKNDSNVYFSFFFLSYLPNYVVDDLVDGEADVGVDGEHLSQCVFILCGIQVTIQ